MDRMYQSCYFSINFWDPGAQIHWLHVTAVINLNARDAGKQRVTLVAGPAAPNVFILQISQLSLAWNEIHSHVSARLLPPLVLRHRRRSQAEDCCEIQKVLLGCSWLLLFHWFIEKGSLKI